jgi:pimeloyl-ACP methyl ester carboxylesterase
MSLKFDDFLSNKANFVEPDTLVMFDNQGGLTAGLFRPTTTPQCVLIFYHGGGANMVGYGGLAHTLRQTAPVAVLTPDIRGHGRSSGPRGFAPTPDLVWSISTPSSPGSSRPSPGRLFLSADTPPGADW